MGMSPNLGGGPIFGMLDTFLFDNLMHSDESQISGHLAP
jgi:hypothetical protein